MSYLLYILSVLLSINLAADESTSELIQHLQSEIDNEQLKAANIETEGQKQMMLDWRGYAEDIEKARKHFDRAEQLEKQIENLEKSAAK